MSARHTVASYLLFQAVVVLAWWVCLLFVPGAIQWFQPKDWPEESLLGFWLADLVLLAVGSMATSFAVLLRKSWSTIAIWSLAAACWYPTLYCVGVSLMTDEVWIASAAMVSMAGLTLAMATVHGTSDQQPQALRVTQMNPLAAILWTLAQIVIFWSVFLWVLPKAVLEVERLVGWEVFRHPYQIHVALLLFAAASSLGFWSAYTLSTIGEGTPLPTATAPKLVAAGPYRYVRNPMAVAGITQGLAVGWYFGSPLVIAYAFAGGFVWHFLVRPVEEADLMNRFGDQYSKYQKSVGLWIPSLRLH